MNNNIPLFLEIKNEYTEHLVDTLTPYIYEGINSVYRGAVKAAEDSNATDKTLIIFQKLLQSVATWNQIKIDEETNRIKQLSNTSDYLDDLVKAVIKSNIILLAYSNTISNIIGQSFYNNLSTSSFVHRCYTECAKDAHNNPYLFYHDVSPMDLKRNQIIIQQNIQTAITRAIRKILPISMILKEYLVNSINIFNEPPKVELIGGPSNETQAGGIGPTNPPGVGGPVGGLGVGGPVVDPKLDKEVMNMIKSEHGKSDKQKVKDIMNLDKIINSIDKPKLSEHHIKNLATKEPVSTSAHPHNQKLTKSDKDVLNIDFDKEKTVEGSTKESTPQTSISNKPQPKLNAGIHKVGYEASERVDPENVNIIEDYGDGQNGGWKNKKGMKKKV